MAKPKHTPAPWHVRSVVKCEGESYETRGLTVEGSRGTICDLYDDIGPALIPYPKALQNAHLIAAAPAMLAALRVAEEACKGASDDLHNQGFDAVASDVDSVLSRIRAAISTAEGRSNG